jgi:hypothetical protein
VDHRLLSLVIAPPPAAHPAPVDDSARRVNVWRTAEGTVSAFACSDGDEHWLHVPGVASFRFASDPRVTAVPHGHVSTQSIRHVFDHSVLPLALQALGREGFHASAVLTANGVVGFCGKTHTGKSTLAYALSRRGFAQWSDDALIWEVNGDRPSTRRLEFHVRLRDQSLAHFGHRSASDIPGSPLDAQDRARLSSLYVLSRTTVDGCAPRVAIEQLTGARALTTLLDHAHCFNPSDQHRKRQMMCSYLALLSQVPVFEVRFQPALAHLDELVDAIIQTAGWPDGPGRRA